MKKKILNKLGFIITIYGLSQGFAFFEAMFDVTNGYVIAFIKPLAYFIIIYQYLYGKEAKHDWRRAYALLHAEIDNKDKQIDRLKKQLDAIEIPVTPARIGTPLTDNTFIPYSQDNDTTEQVWICPECGSEMTRQTDKTVFCDNIECTRKQWKKELL